MDIDVRAAVVARAQVRVQSDRQAVWEVLSDFDGWPRWNADIEEMSIKGPLAPGTAFAWKAGPGRIRSRLVSVDPPREIGWTGRTFGIRAIDVYRLIEDGDQTLVVQHESWSGLPARLLKKRLQHMLQASIEKGLQSLKTEVERRAVQRRPARRGIA